MEGTRLNKYLAECGVCSRREADKLIESGKVLVNGVVAPIAGNICMDQCMIDVTNVPYVRLGDEVTIIGKDGIHEILADDIATATGTINYEIVCAFGQRLPKVYVY